jgi:hypothetical protein
MANTYTKIATYSVGVAGAATVSFLSIPQTYTDLLLRVSGRGSRNDQTFDQLQIRFNGDSSTIYSDNNVYGLNSGVGAGRDTSVGITNQFAYVSTGYDGGNIFGNSDVYIPNYTGSNYKSAIAESVAENNLVGNPINVLGSTLYRSNSAITSIVCSPASGSWVNNSTFTLYGIKNS